LPEVWNGFHRKCSPWMLGRSKRCARNGHAGRLVAAGDFPSSVCSFSAVRPGSGIPVWCVPTVLPSPAGLSSLSPG
jgi:hypothetical protein